MLYFLSASDVIKFDFPFHAKIEFLQTEVDKNQNHAKCFNTVDLKHEFVSYGFKNVEYSSVRL